MSLETNIGRIRDANIELIGIRSSLIALAREAMRNGAREYNVSHLQIAEEINAIETRVESINQQLSAALNCEETN